MRPTFQKNMNSISLLLMQLVILISANAFAQFDSGDTDDSDTDRVSRAKENFTNAVGNHDVGLGIVLGSPTGLSFKYNLNVVNSIDAALAWSDSLDFYLHATYLWTKYKLFYLDNYPVDWYFGVGGRIRDRDNHKQHGEDNEMWLGIRAPLGLRFMFKDPRIEIFTEISGIFNFIPSSDVDLDFGVGARYFF